MAVNDITIRAAGPFSVHGTRRFLVNTGATAINAGEPVVLAAAFPYAYVAAMATTKPVIRTDYVVGIAQSAGAAGGTVDVFPAVPGVTYAIAPKSASVVGLGSTLSQTQYNSTIGYRVTLDLTSGVYTINATDAATNGCVVEYVDVTKAQGRVSFSFRSLATLWGADSS